jgi:hypothetical protein
MYPLSKDSGGRLDGPPRARGVHDGYQLEQRGLTRRDVHRRRCVPCGTFGTDRRQGRRPRLGCGISPAFTTHWDKTSQEFVVSGEWAFERYSYKSTDTPKAGGANVIDTGWGLVIYHHDADGRWRVARDAFSTEAALPAK